MCNSCFSRKPRAAGKGPKCMAKWPGGFKWRSEQTSRSAGAGGQADRWGRTGGRRLEAGGHDWRLEYSDTASGLVTDERAGG